MLELHAIIICLKGPFSGLIATKFKVQKLDSEKLDSEQNLTDHAFFLNYVGKLYQS